MNLKRRCWLFRSYIPRVLRRSHVLHVAVARQRHGRDDQSRRVRKMQPPTSRAGPEDSRSQVQRREGAVQRQRTLDTHHRGAEQLHISDAERPHGRVGNVDIRFLFSFLFFSPRVSVFGHVRREYIKIVFVRARVCQTCVPEQEKSEGAEISGDFDSLSTKELAYHMTLFDWELFWNVHEVRSRELTDDRSPTRPILFLVRADIPDVRQTPVPADHRQPGHIPAAVQRDPVLGDHRDMHVAEHIQEDQHTEEND